MFIDLDPTIFTLGPVQVRWYGLMYVVGFLVGTQMIAYTARQGFVHMLPQKTDSLITYCLVGMFICARAGYVLVYNLENTHSLLDAIAVWRGGLSFHGALVGFILATWIFSRRHGVSVWQLYDSLALAAPQGLFFGRLGNFINGELYGRPTDVPWAMVFATDPDRLPRHPSQLYEACGEGLVLLVFLWWLKGRVRNYGVISGSFIAGYGVVRYFVEFFRQPDVQRGLYFGGTTSMGQILCFLMVVAGAWWIWQAKRRHHSVVYRPVLSQEGEGQKKAAGKRAPKKEKRTKRNQKN